MEFFYRRMLYLSLEYSMERDGTMKVHQRRRILSLLCSAFLGLILCSQTTFAGGTPKALNSDGSRPKVKKSEARKIILRHVENISQSARLNLGHELSDRKKSELVEILLGNMEARHVYDFVDR